MLPKRDANGSAVPDTGIPALAAFYNGDVSEAMQRLAQSADGKQLNRLSQEETIELRDILRSYAAMIINEDRLFMQKRQDSFAGSRGRAGGADAAKKKRTSSGAKRRKRC